MIVLSERFEDPRVSFIDCDSERESARAVEYLIALGHRRIAFGMNIVADTDHADRLAGYRQALTEHGIPFDEKLILKQKADFAGGASAIQILMAMRQPPTAVYFADPALAVGAINGAHQAGIRIPEDVSIVGFDDAELRHSVHPVMTAVCQNAADLGFDAAQELTQMILRQTGEPVRKILTTFFEINQSTAPPPDQPVRVIAGKEPE